MRKIIIDGYEISVEDGKFTKATFTDADGNEVTINLGEDLRLEFVKRRREEFKEQYEKRKHIDRFIKDDYMFEVKSSNNGYSIEEEFIKDNERNQIIKEIWSLPEPQNRRVFMSVVNKYSLTKIASIEGVSVNAVKYSIELGKKKLQKNSQPQEQRILSIKVPAPTWEPSFYPSQVDYKYNNIFRCHVKFASLISGILVDG